MKYFHPVCNLSFILLKMPVQNKILNFDKIPFINFFLLGIMLCYSKNILPNLSSQRFSPMLSFKSFIVLHFIFRSMTHSELIFAWCLEYSLRFTLMHMSIQLFLHIFLKKEYPFSIELHLNFCQNLLDHICVSLFLESVFCTFFPPIPHSFEYCTFLER